MDPGKEDVFVRSGLVIPESELRFTYARASGPGGQKVNKTSVKARLAWKPAESRALMEGLTPAERTRLLRRAAREMDGEGAVQVVSDTHRSREANREACRRKLAERIRRWLEKPKPRIPTAPTRAAKKRRLEAKRRHSAVKRARRAPPTDE